MLLSLLTLVSVLPGREGGWSVINTQHYGATKLSLAPHQGDGLGAHVNSPGPPPGREEEEREEGGGEGGPGNDSRFNVFSSEQVMETEKLSTLLALIYFPRLLPARLCSGVPSPRRD